MMKVLSWLIGLALFFSGWQVSAQILRDPTLPPSERGANPGVLGDAGLDQAAGAMTLIKRNGRSYLVMGTRLYTTGQKIGQARIERISETEVWLREGGVLRKLPQFSGIERRTVTPRVVKPTCSSTAPQKSSAFTPCVDTQP